ncbi:restriction endonuclease [Nostoc sp.]|uniref:restriction endonuclease n=1 Tax=Nostoc sp. TaxID=1180 RepID=UPI002FF28944
MSINRELYSEEVADAFWKRFDIVHINQKRRGKKIPRIYRVVGSSQKLFYGGYIVICEPTLPNREAFVKQNSYEYWSDQFYLSSGIYANPSDQNAAIALLLNKISTNSEILRDIPTKTDWRVFEEIVAEIFRKFGYEIELTKKTRDGGKDIIALRKNGSEITERLLIECKHWQAKIDVKSIRSLIGVAVTQNELPTGIILATTSTFTEDAKELKINFNISIELDLKDYDDILHWIGDYNAIQLTPAEIEQYLREQ